MAIQSHNAFFKRDNKYMQTQIKSFSMLTPSWESDRTATTVRRKRVGIGTDKPFIETMTDFYL